MMTLITTWLTEKIVAVLTVSLVTVAAVPAVLVVTTEHQVTVTVQQQQQQQQIVLVTTVKTAGDDLIVKLLSAEDSCNTQIVGLVSDKKVDPGKIQSQLATAKTQIHASIAPFIALVQTDQRRFAKLSVVTPADEETELAHLQVLAITALGGDGTTGVVTIHCQTVLVEIQQVVLVVLQIQPSDSSRACHIEVQIQGGQYQYQREGC